jgi:hypothetical protein
MGKYTYKFSEGDFDYYRDNESMQIVKVVSSLHPRTDANIQRHAVDAEQDDAVGVLFLKD